MPEIIGSSIVPAVLLWQSDTGVAILQVDFFRIFIIHYDLFCSAMQFTAYPLNDIRTYFFVLPHFGQCVSAQCAIGNRISYGREVRKAGQNAAIPQ
jgi:hypothetical protein